MKKVLAVLAVAGLASTAMAQSFDGRVAFRADHVANVNPTISNGGVHIVDVTGLTAPVTLDFAIMLGAFDASGFTNRGLFAWVGDLVGTGGGYSLTNQLGTRPPFAFSPAGNGTPNGTAINNIDVARSPLFTVEWPDGMENPPLPNTTQGRDAYFSAFRFRVTLTDLTDREFTINAAGIMTAIAGFEFLGGEEGATADWTAGPFASAPAAGGFTIRLVPAPGAAALLGLGGLVAARRRRA